MSDTELTASHPVVIKVDLRNVDFNGLVEATSATAPGPNATPGPVLEPWTASPKSSFHPACPLENEVSYLETCCRSCDVADGSRSLARRPGIEPSPRVANS